jgi:hypothetical protein
MEKKFDSLLIEAFINWAEQVKMRCRPDVSIEVVVGPLEDKQGASISFEDTNSASTIAVWSSGEFECEYRHTDNSLDTYNYTENVSPDQFEKLALPVLSNYLA